MSISHGFDRRADVAKRPPAFIGRQRRSAGMPVGPPGRKAPFTQASTFAQLGSAPATIGSANWVAEFALSFNPRRGRPHH
jgi:hypothetical protein